MNAKLLEKLQNPLCDELGLIGGIAGASISAIGQAASNEQTFEHNKELMGLQFGYGEQAAENAKQRLLEINQHNWEHYNSYEAQRASMEAAGLSPALLYGSKGQGGTGVASGSPQGTGTGLPNSPVGNVGLAAVQGAQLGLIQAQARETEAKAKSIESKLPLETQALEIQNRVEGVKAEVQEATKQDQINTIWQQMLGEYAKTNILENQAGWENAVKENALNPLEAQVLNIMADTAKKGVEITLTEKKTKLTENQAKKVFEEIDQIIKEKEFTLLQKEWYVRKIFIDAGVELAGDVISSISKVFKKPTQITQTTNNDNRGADQTKYTQINNNGPQY